MTKTPSIAFQIREFIKQGWDNKTIFDKMSSVGLLNDKQKHYPAWYRSELRRKGNPAPQSGLAAVKNADGATVVVSAAEAKRLKKNAAERARRAAKKVA